MNITSYALPKVSNKRNNLKGIVIYSFNGPKEADTGYTLYNFFRNNNEYKSDYYSGYHYAIDEDNIINFAKDDIYLDHLSNETMTSISLSLYEAEDNQETMSLCIYLRDDHDLLKTEKYSIIYTAKLLMNHKLSTDCLWREIDLNNQKTSVLYSDNKKWELFIKEVNKVIDYYGSHKDLTELEIISNLYSIIGVHSSSKQIIDYIEGFDKLDKSKFTPWNRNIEAASKEFTQEELDFIVNKKPERADQSNSKLNNEMFETTTIGNLGSSSSKVNLNSPELMVEPMYPDTTVPPSMTSGGFNDGQDSASQNISGVVSLEEYEKRQKIFNPKEYLDEKGNTKKEAIKEDRGRPVNNNDPYPVDEKIFEIQEHYPKVAIDSINIDSMDSFATDKMIIDSMMDQSKRVETRLVRLENVFSMLLRYVYRLAARVPINCVYYGGQNIFNKYKCIRCLHTDRINDGDSLSIDQCLNCSRYEPIMGQVYDILDASGENLSQVLDNIQLSYSDMKSYITSNRIEEMSRTANKSNLLKIIEKNNLISEIKAGINADYIKTESSKNTVGSDINIIEPKLDFKEMDIRNATNMIVLHHAEHPNCSVEEVHQWHLDNGWAGIGYHFFIRKDGKIYRGRPEETVGSHCKGNNETSIGICAEGNYMKETMNEAQKTALINLTAYLKGKYKVNKVYGHREAGSSNCPGINYPLDEIKDKANNITVNATNNQSTSVGDEQVNDIIVERIDKIIGGGIPKSFKQLWPEGFKMDWAETPLNTQSPNINKYNASTYSEYDEDYFKDKNKYNTGFEDTRSFAPNNNKLIYSSVNYSEDSLYTGAVNSNEIRDKILQKAKDILQMNKEGKAGYGHARPAGSIGTTGRIEYDCSGLTDISYKAAQLTIGGWTGEQYPNCMPNAGGIIIPIKDESKAIPGDLIFFCHNLKGQPIDNLPYSIYGDGSNLHHVAIYIGNGELIESSTAKAPLKEQMKISKIKDKKTAFCFGRPKALVDIDKKFQSSMVGGDGIFNLNSHTDLPADLRASGETMKGRAKSTIENMNKYKYKADVINLSKKHNVDPYFTLAMICTESTGNPNDNTGSYWGLMQVAPSYFSPQSSYSNPAINIDEGLKHFKKLAKYVKDQKGINYCNMMLAIYAYNSGNGNVCNALKISNKDFDKITMSEMAIFIRTVVKRDYPSWSSKEKYEYCTRVVYAYNYLKGLKALD